MIHEHPSSPHLTSPSGIPNPFIFLNTNQMHIFGIRSFAASAFKRTSDMGWFFPHYICIWFQWNLLQSPRKGNQYRRQVLQQGVTIIEYKICDFKIKTSDINTHVDIATSRLHRIRCPLSEKSNDLTVSGNIIQLINLLFINKAVYKTFTDIPGLSTSKFMCQFNNQITKIFTTIQHTLVNQ